MSGVSGSPLGQSAGPLNANGGNSYVTDQWIRRWELVVYNPATQGPGHGRALVLSAGDGTPGLEQLRMRFDVITSVVPTPNSAVVRVYNPAPTTVSKVRKEFNRLTLSAGYRSGRFGTIFDGWITQFRWGGETSVDKYLDLYAQDGDLALNQTTLSKILMPGFSGPKSVLGSVLQEMTKNGAYKSAQVPPNISVAPGARPYVLYGMAADEMDNLAHTTGYIWSVQKGKLVLIPETGGDALKEEVVVNALTGLIGFPNQTNDGLEFRTLLSPDATIGQRVRINNAEINQRAAGVGGGVASGLLRVQTPEFGQTLYAPVSDDGSYLVVNVGFKGDTRGEDWYTDYIAVTVDPQSQTVTAAEEITPSTDALAREMGVDSPEAH